ncbi:hypothetical protein AAFC00_006157 [Neodothiora populina]|uniref:nitric oxide dioxygenase n=1 Tax=Neodothiora populina TaxID=2781224 RepID=A0ABR3P4D9_9PEZI
MPLTPHQTTLIKATVPILKAHGNEITTRFYESLISEVPSLKNIFNLTNQKNGHQPMALASSLYAYASYIDDLGVLSPAVEKICQKHAALFVRPEQYDVVGTYLLRAMGEVLGEGLTDEVKEAWAVAYQQLASIMINREAELTTQSPDNWSDWRDFRIVRKVPESSNITSFYLEPVDGGHLPSFKPGQYISVRVDVPELGCMQTRQYSLSDAPGKPYYRISVKREDGVLRSSASKTENMPGVISNILHLSKSQGDIIQLSNPAGDFFYDGATDKGPVVCISAGVGVTPMMSILESPVASPDSSSASTNGATGNAKKITFIHATHDSETQPFTSFLSSISARNPDSIRTIIFNPRPSSSPLSSSQPAAATAAGGLQIHTTRLALSVLNAARDLFLDDKEAVYFVCGPASFMSDVRAWLEGKGVESTRVRSETFGTGALLG